LANGEPIDAVRLGDECKRLLAAAVLSATHCGQVGRIVWQLGVPRVVSIRPHCRKDNFAMVFRFLKTDRAKVADFRKARSRQTDEEFLAQCGLSDTPQARRVALAVRRAAANVGLVDSQFIRVDDDYPGSLELLPLWDSMDWLEFFLELEEELGEKLADKELLTSFGKSRVTVKEMATRVYDTIAERR
jgi:acyl carrier protein